jgi:TPR repeat protein
MKFSLSIGLILLLLAGSAIHSLGQTADTERKEFEALKARADKGDGEAQLSVAARYANGDGVAPDSAKSAKYLRKAAEQGVARAECLLALRYSNGDGVKLDKAEAARWLHRAAVQGLPEAQYDLGMCYARGDGVGENAVQAVEWYRKAADQGLLDAQSELGTCYFEGNGVPTDIPEGVKWTRLAAERGSGVAQNTIGLCYAKGRGVAKDYVEAYKWFNLAAAKGGDLGNEAKMNLAMAERSLTPEQVAEGQRLAREFKPTRAARPGEAPAQPAKADSGAAASSPDSRSGIVIVTAGDDACEIFVNGGFVGNAPAKVILPEGSHIVEVKKPGFKDYRKQLKISAGSELTLRAVLEKQ